MRIATMIISLILMLVVGAQSCAVSLGDAALQTKAAEQGGPIGLFMAFLFLIGGAFALVRGSGVSFSRWCSCGVLSLTVYSGVWGID